MAENGAASPTLVIEGLHAAINGQEILHGINLTLNKGEVHAIMGPNGSGKSTLAYALMGHPTYEVTQGRVRFKGEDLLEMEPDERAKAGLFLAFQYPTSIPGINMGNFLRLAVRARFGEERARQFRKLLTEKLRLLKMDRSFMRRYLNDGFSGGEKKRSEILQMALLEPEFAILDETDSGLDIDALRVVADGVNAQMSPDLGVLVITHYQRLLNYIEPDFVHVLLGGHLVRSGGPELALYLEEHGYDPLIKELRATDQAAVSDTTDGAGIESATEMREHSVVGGDEHDPFRSHGRTAI